MFFLPSVYAVALLLSLTAATPVPEDCVHLSKTLSAEELHTIYGKWILHENYISSSRNYSSMSPVNIYSTLIEFIASENNQKVIFKQAIRMNLFSICTSGNFTVVENTIQATTGNTTFIIEFLKTCDDCLMIRYNGPKVDGEQHISLLFHKKTDVLTQTEQEEAKKQARCLGFQQPPVFTYQQAGLPTAGVCQEFLSFENQSCVLS